MMLVRTYVAQSPIEGIGIYAAEPIQQGTLIWQLDHRLDLTVTLEELCSLPSHQQDYFQRYSFPHLQRPGHIVLEFDNGRFMNHTLKPNTDFTQFDKGWAIRDIAVGEEITCNYHEFDPTFAGHFGDGRADAHVVASSGNGIAYSGASP